MSGLLSIAWRELAVGARQTSTHRSRLVAGLIVVGFFVVFVSLESGPPSVAGPKLLLISSYLLFLQALLSGVRYTADALSEERREGTLGLLFLTELCSGEVVLGKMLVRSLRGLYAMIAALPVFTFCILLGGVRGIDAVNMAIWLLTTMVFSLSAGMYVSSRTTDDKAAFLGTVALMTALCVIPPIIWKIYSIATQSGALDFILSLSPIYGMGTSPRTGRLSSEFYGSVFCSWIISAVFLALAARNLRIKFNTQFVELVKVPPENAVTTPVLGESSKRRLETNPFRWLLDRERLYRKILAVYAVFGLAGPWIAIKWLNSGTPGAYVSIIINSLYALHAFWKLLVASDALRRLHHDRRSGALEQLLVTHVTVEQILSAQVNRTFWLFIPSAIALASGNYLFFSDWVFGSLRLVGFGGAIILLIDARALIWQAALQALKPARYPLAILRAAGITLAPPIVILMLILWTGQTLRSGSTDDLFFLWFLGCGIYDVILIQTAKSKLKNHFRELASEPLKARKNPSLPNALKWLLLMEPRPMRRA